MQLVIFGIPIGALIILGFQIWATGLVIDAIEPELEGLLMQLNDKMICHICKSNYFINFIRNLCSLLEN